MTRTSVNIIGIKLASCVIARWEREFDDEKVNLMMKGPRLLDRLT